MKLDVVSPEEYLGDIISELSSRRGHIESMERQGDLGIIHAFAPLSETFGYATSLRSLTQGRATYAMEFSRYKELPGDLTDRVTGKAVGVKYA